jgi:hypothetical protein
MSELVQEGEIVEVRLRIRVPACASEDDVERWLKLELAHGGSLSVNSPLARHYPETWGPYGFEWEREGVIGVREEYDHEDLGEGKRRYKVRYRERAA